MCFFSIMSKFHERESLDAISNRALLTQFSCFCDPEPLFIITGANYSQRVARTSHANRDHRRNGQTHANVLWIPINANCLIWSDGGAVVSPFAALSYSNRHEWVYAMGVVHTIRETGENGGRAKVIVTHYHCWRIRRCTARCTRPRCTYRRTIGPPASRRVASRRRWRNTRTYRGRRSDVDQRALLMIPVDVLREICAPQLHVGKELDRWFKKLRNRILEMLLPTCNKKYLILGRKSQAFKGTIDILWILVNKCKSAKYKEYNLAFYDAQRKFVLKLWQAH